MSPEISFPPNLTFKEFLSHTFPGFFLALSVFMLLDVLSPKDLTSWAFGSLTDFLSAMAFIILLGTILGILIDGIQHLIEENIFVCRKSYKDKVAKRTKAIYPSGFGVGHYYFYKRIGENAFDHLTDKYYRYAEFYGNIFISLIAFSLISPFYLYSVLKIHVVWSSIFGCVVPLVLSGICIWSSFATFVEYHSNRIDMILESLGTINTIEVTVDEKCLNITAQLKKWKLEDLEDDEKRSLGMATDKKFCVWNARNNCLSGVKVYFKTDKGTLSPIPKIESEKDGKSVNVPTDENGKAQVRLKSEESAKVNVCSEGLTRSKIYIPKEK